MITSREGLADLWLRVVDRLTRRSQQIGQFPHSGRAVPECDLPHLREVLEVRIVLSTVFAKIRSKLWR
jgi:hypothetical protein